MSKTPAGSGLQPKPACKIPIGHLTTKYRNTKSPTTISSNKNKNSSWGLDFSKAIVKTGISLQTFNADSVFL
ncbi:MAG: hypothetical protein H3C64_15070 [Candidatus Kuenenia stuttgartiensis]|jgi:hypothetical protein|uniref:hypothetical protein n=1 Tax=Candidatus Kuenenia sp. TaxID=2499824 RepID=UPI0012FEC2AF|nr:hypothetical protein [Planctomycetia bacterium]MBW7943660.1 hypothetical protein [Candidatus Kuenenia stuttgartiensis]